MAGFAAVSLAILAPVLADPTGRALGHRFGDLYQHLWARWWPGHALLQGRSPFRTDLLNYPDGGSFYPIDLLGALAALPFAAGGAAGATLAHNLLALGNLVLGCWGAYLLAGRVARSRPAGLAGGAAYGLSPYVLSCHHNGVTELTWTAALPLYLLSLVLCLERATPRRAAACAVLLALAGLSNFYYAVVAGLATLLVAPWTVHRRSLGPTAAAVAAGGLLILPAAIAFRAHLDDPRALISPAQAAAGRPMEAMILPAPREYWDPGAPTYLPTPYHHTVYPGWCLLALAAAGGWRRRAGVPWVAAALVFGALSMGPFLTVEPGSGPVRPVEPRVALPYSWLASALPPLARMNFPYRLVLGAQLGLAVLGALSLAPLLARLPRRGAWAAGSLVAAAILAETALASPAPFPLASAATRVEAAQGAGGLVDLPLVAGDLDPRETHGNLSTAVKFTWGRYLAAQMDHGRPIPLGIADHLPAVWERVPLLRGLVEREPAARELLYGPAGPGGRSPAAPGDEDLAGLGFSAVVVHHALAPDPGLVPWLEERLGPGVRRGDLTEFAVPESRSGEAASRDVQRDAIRGR